MASQYDRRYRLHAYDGIRETILNFLPSARLSAVLDVGCGTGHWLPLLADHARVAAGMDMSANMLALARVTAPGVPLVRARAEQPPWRDASFDRILCVHALHHFTDRAAFLEHARRILAPGGGLLTVGLDPHGGRDRWWVYDYFPEAIELDRARFAPVRIIRGEMTTAGFAWAESFEADHLDVQLSLAETFPGGSIDRGFTSQFTIMSDEEFARGVERLRTAAGTAAARGEDVPLVSDLHFYATVGWR